jgi:hypothetical protein
MPSRDDFLSYSLNLHEFVHFKRLWISTKANEWLLGLFEREGWEGLVALVEAKLPAVDALVRRRLNREHTLKKVEELAAKDPKPLMVFLEGLRRKHPVLLFSREFNPLAWREASCAIQKLFEQLPPGPDLAQLAFMARVVRNHDLAALLSHQSAEAQYAMGWSLPHLLRMQHTLDLNLLFANFTEPESAIKFSGTQACSEAIVKTWAKAGKSDRFSSYFCYTAGPATDLFDFAEIMPVAPLSPGS